MQLKSFRRPAKAEGEGQVAADEPTPEPGGQQQRNPENPGRARMWFAVAGGTLAVGLFAGGTVFGWWLANQTLIASNETAAQEAQVEPIELPSGPLMPDVRGLEKDVAAQVIADAGIEISRVEFVDEPSAAPEGVVVTQSPTFGSENPASIRLGVAKPTTVPALVGTSREDAVSTLASLGVAPKFTFQYSVDAAPGEVVAVAPKEGEPLGEEVTVTLATAGATFPLGDADTLTNDCRTRSGVTAGGTEYQAGIVCETNPADATTTIWLLAGNADRVTGTLAIADTAAAGSTGKVQILVNGSQAFEATVKYGDTVPVDIPITGALQLAVTVTSATETEIVLGDPLLYGSEAAIDELAAQ